VVNGRGLLAEAPRPPLICRMKGNSTAVLFVYTARGVVYTKFVYKSTNIGDIFVLMILFSQVNKSTKKLTLLLGNILE
jgi:hypothetical protein